MSSIKEVQKALEDGEEGAVWCLLWGTEDYDKSLILSKVAFVSEHGEHPAHPFVDEHKRRFACAQLLSEEAINIIKETLEEGTRGFIQERLIKALNKEGSKGVLCYVGNTEEHLENKYACMVHSYVWGSVCPFNGEWKYAIPLTREEALERVLDADNEA